MNLDRLQEALADAAPAAIALSGGVDSMTLAFVAHRLKPGEFHMFHAHSPAVPAAALARIEAYAAREGWPLHIVDAGEFDDERYLANPSNRCFFCKSDLYGTLAEITDRQLLSGTNLDDLGDWRPGLEAARAKRVRHPFVEAGIDKAGVRAIAASLGLDDLAELPSAPCLSSRVETGIRIDAADLQFIDRIEELVRSRHAPETVRCRLRADALVIEIEPETALDAEDRSAIRADIIAMFERPLPVRFEPYRRGSAFLRKDPPLTGISTVEPEA
ncbi:MAG: asparagine synthase-related protein [Geminicoccaceae bacterium]